MANLLLFKSEGTWKRTQALGKPLHVSCKEREAPAVLRGAVHMWALQTLGHTCSVSTYGTLGYSPVTGREHTASSRRADAALGS